MKKITQFEVVTMLMASLLASRLFAQTPPASAATAAPASAAAAPAPRTGADIRSSPAITPWIIPPVYQAGTSTSGNISVSNTEVTQLMDEQMKEYFRRSDEDRKFLESSLESVNALFQKFAFTIVNDYTNAADQSMAGDQGEGKIGADKYFRMRKAYRDQKNAIELEIKKLAGISQGALPSARLQITEKSSTEIPGWRSIDMSKIIAYYTQKLADIDTEMSGLQFTVYDKRNVPSTQTLAKIDLSTFSMMSPEEVTAQQQKANALRKTPATYLVAVNNLNNNIVKMAGVVRSNFGLNERYRWRNAEDLKARADEFKRFAEGIWLKSFVRVAFGLPTGGIPMTYLKKILSYEEFLQDPTSYMNFDGKAIMNQKQLDDSIEASRKNFQVASKRISSIFSGNFNPLTNLNTAITFARGYKPQMEVSAAVTEMVAADTVEEAMTYSAQGADKILAFYKSRFYTDQATTKDIKEREQKYRAVLENKNPTSMVMNMATEGSPDSSDTGSVESAGYNLFREMRLYEGRYKASMAIQASVDEFNKVSSGDGGSISDSRLNGL